MAPGAAANAEESENTRPGPESKLTEQQKGELMACFHSFDEDNSGHL